MADVLKNKIKPAGVTIICNTNGITINGTQVVFPMHLNILKEIFGEPSLTKYDKWWNVAWDSYGVYCDYGSWDNILSLNFLIKKTDNLNYLPQNVFAGTIVVNNKDLKGIKSESIELGKNKVNKIRDNGKGEFFGCSIGKNYNYKHEIPIDKYLIPKINSEVIAFKDFNFKLAVIQELMYNKELLKPRFDLYEFVNWFDKRKINLEEEGYSLIPEITKYFIDLPVPLGIANVVTEIYQDGGNEIYLQMVRFWNGEDDLFNIRSSEDVVYFPNLKKVTLFYEDEPVVKNEFISKGIHVEYL